jgi:RNA-dependent RNA polymerase
MNIGFKYAPNECSKWDLTRKISNILHSENFAPRTEGERLINFRVKLNPNPAGGVRSDGTGTLIVSSEKLGNKLLEHLYNDPLKIDKKKVKFFREGVPPKGLALELEKTPYVNPDVEEARERKLRALEARLRVDIVQFGTFYRPNFPSKDGEPLHPRAFSIEWEGNYVKNSIGWLTFEYDYKLIRITVSLDLQSILSPLDLLIAVPLARK